MWNLLGPILGAIAGTAVFVIPAVLCYGLFKLLLFVFGYQTVAGFGSVISTLLLLVTWPHVGSVILSRLFSSDR